MMNTKLIYHSKTLLKTQDFLKGVLLKAEMEKRYFIITLLFTLILLIFMNVSAVIDEAKINTFKERYGSDWIISWNEVTDTPHSIIGSSYDFEVSTINTKEKAEAVATNFLFENSNLFKAKSDNVRLLSVEQGNNEWYVEYQQYYQNLTVFNGKTYVTLSNEGKLISTGSDIYSDIYVKNLSLSEEDALNLAKQNFKVISIIDVKKSELIIYPGEGNKYYTVWNIQLFSNSPLKNKEYFIDSTSGNMLSEQNLIVSNEDKPEKNNNYKNGFPISIGFIIFVFLVLLIFYIKYNKNNFVTKIKK